MNALPRIMFVVWVVPRIVRGLHIASSVGALARALETRSLMNVRMHETYK